MCMRMHAFSILGLGLGFSTQWGECLSHSRGWLMSVAYAFHSLIHLTVYLTEVITGMVMEVTDDNTVTVMTPHRYQQSRHLSNSLSHWTVISFPANDPLELCYWVEPVLARQYVCLVIDLLLHRHIELVIMGRHVYLYLRHRGAGCYMV